MKESLVPHETGGNSYLKIHQRTAHENKKPFKCEICQKSFVGNEIMYLALYIPSLIKLMLLQIMLTLIFFQTLANG